MAKTSPDNAEQIKEQLHAFQELFLSLMLALDAHLSDVADDTIIAARERVDGLIDAGFNRKAIRLKALIEDIEQCRG